MLHQANSAFKRDGDLGLADERARIALVMQASSGIGVDKDDLVLKCPCHTQRIDELYFGVIVVLQTFACILDAPVARADDNLHAYSQHGPEDFGKHQIPANNQTDLAKLR